MVLLNVVYVISFCFVEVDILEIGVDSCLVFSNNFFQIYCCGNVICVNGLYCYGFLLVLVLVEMVVNYLIYNEEFEWFMVNFES